VRTTILSLSAVASGVARVNSAVPSKCSSRAIFDSDSYDILVDGGATACISNNASDFIKPPQASKVRVKGFNGSTSSTKVGTVSWTVLDDTGHKRTLKIPNTYYVPECPLRLLSPQHFSQETRDLRGTYSTNFGDHVLFVWDRGRYRATLPLTPSSNVGILRSAPGHKVFSHFVGAWAYPALFASPVVTDDEADLFESDSASDNDTLSGDTTSIEGEDEGEINFNTTGTPESLLPANLNQDVVTKRPNIVPFDLDHDHPPTNLLNQDDAISNLDASSELMRWHCRLCHLPFENI
jgi:hypothetical protein